MELIHIDHITKDYGNNRGVFDVSFSVNPGEVMGFLGPNGAGKTTTIRQLMGFIKPQKGRVSILGLNCFTEADLIAQRLGYLPGEIAFIDDMQGLEFIHFVAKMKRIKDLTRAKELMEQFQIDPKGKIRKMSKGMKQKIGIICCFMQEAEIYILDEPTSGLDPLMQNIFIDLILEEKAKGKTILMSSHIFEEVERTCDRTAIIRQGRIVAVEDMASLRKNKRRVVDVDFDNEETATAFSAERQGSIRQGAKVTLDISGDMNHFLKDVSRYNVVDMNMRSQSLEELFLDFYGGENRD